jgi:N-acetyl-alpha-D-muramate 1-phosphate uridylyltransferase
MNNLDTHTAAHALDRNTPPARAQVMILAAGRGERMRPLTDHCPKPLLKVQGQTLLERHVKAFVHAGFEHQLINTAWLGEQIETALGNGQSLGASLRYSHEGQDFGHALETAGGIARALPYLDDVFWLVAGDVFVPRFVYNAQAFEDFKSSTRLAHLWLVANPAHNPLGDFGLSDQGLALDIAKDRADIARWTYSTIGLYKRTFFERFSSIPAGNPTGEREALAPLLRAAMRQGEVSAEIYKGEWTDVGTPERLAQLNA